MNGMRIQVGLVAVAMAVLLVGCSVGPKYAKSTVPTAPAYSEQPPQQFEESQGWMTAQPSDAMLKGKWWEIFGESELNGLEEQVGPANQSLKIAEANYREARANIQFQRSFRFPTVSAGPSISTNRVSSYNPTGANGLQYGLFSLPINASFDADLWGRIRKSIEAAKEQTQASAADMENVKLELQTELASYYFTIRGLDSQKRLLDDTVVAYQKAYDLTNNRYNGGVASKAEVAQAKTQLNQTQAQEIDLGVQRAQLEHAIAVLTGRPPENFHVSLAELKNTLPVIPVGVPSQLLERRPDIASSERQVAAANAQIGIAKAAFYPDLVIAAQGGLQAGSIVNWFTWPSRFWSVGPQLAQTIFDAGQRRSQVNISQAAYDATIASYRQTSLTAFQEVEDNLSTLRILEQEAAMQHEATQAAENSQQLAMNRYKGGLVTYLEVITAQSIALSNERTEVDLMQRRMDASVQLVRALGGGWDVSKLPKT
jgi:NodT family efflux transporter outer membrane factor (OMF) lipoprotein